MTQTLTATFHLPADMTKEQVGAALKRTGLKVKRARFHKLGRPPLSDDLQAAILSHALEGHSNRAIAKLTGVSDVTVGNIIRAPVGKP